MRLIPSNTSGGEGKVIERDESDLTMSNNYNLKLDKFGLEIIHLNGNAVN